MEFLWGRDTSDINLKPLKEAISRKNASFSDMSQHDMVEFFVRLVFPFHVVFVGFYSERGAGRKQGVSGSVHRHESASSVGEPSESAFKHRVRQSVLFDVYEGALFSLRSILGSYH